MRHRFALMTMLLLFMTGVFMTSCEKHEENYYFKQNCTAQLNGQSYIDQTRLESVMLPLARVTPCLEHDGPNYLCFTTELAKERDSAMEYYIDIYLNAESVTELVGKEILFKKESMPAQSTNQSLSEYYRWLRENSYNYAHITTDRYANELAELGSFRIEFYDEKESLYCGSFSLQFSEGTMTGKFKVLPVDNNTENN